MKKILIIAVLLFPASLKSQNISDPLVKDIIKGNYVFRNIPVKIENGHEDTVLVNFTLIIKTPSWDSVLTKYGFNETKAFTDLASVISYQAQHYLKNPLSFEPFSKQDIMYGFGKFYCTYKMSGRNDLGNMEEIEETIVINGPKYNDGI